MRVSLALLLGGVMLLASACALSAGGEPAHPAPMPFHALGARQGT